MQITFHTKNQEGQFGVVYILGDFFDKFSLFHIVFKYTFPTQHIDYNFIFEGMHVLKVIFDKIILYCNEIISSYIQNIKCNFIFNSSSYIESFLKDCRTICILFIYVNMGLSQLSTDAPKNMVGLILINLTGIKQEPSRQSHILHWTAISENVAVNIVCTRFGWLKLVVCGISGGHDDQSPHHPPMAILGEIFQSHLPLHPQSMSAKHILVCFKKSFSINLYL